MSRTRSWLHVFILTWLLTLIPAAVAPSYMAGVEPGDQAVYGDVSAAWESNIPGALAPEFIQILLGVASVETTIVAVSGSNVTAMQTFTYANGTSKTVDLVGSVRELTGNLTFWILASELGPGDPIYDIPGLPAINYTTTAIFAGAVREAFVLNVTESFGSSGHLSVLGLWDRPTGILLHIAFDIFYSFSGQMASGFSQATLTETNIWSPEPSFLLTAHPPSMVVDRPDSGRVAVVSTIILASHEGYSGQVTLQVSVLPSPINGPTAFVNPQEVTLSPGGLASSTLTIEVASDTPAGLYTFNITATDSVQTHTILVPVMVTAPPEPDFAITTPPYVLFVRQGQSNSTLIFLTSTGGFSGTVQLAADIDWSNTIGTVSVSLNPTIVTLSPNFSASSTLTVSASSNSTGTLVIRVNATSGELTHETTVTATIVPGGPANQPPVAVISGPTNAFVGVSVSFNGLGSFDPDGSIQFYNWDFGDSFASFGPFVSHTYQNPGDYQVRLTVTDNLGATGTATSIIHVRPQLAHDVAVVSVQVTPTTVVAGQPVNIFAILENQGTQDEVVMLTVYADEEVLVSRPDIFLSRSDPFGGFVFLTGDTASLVPGSYTISATAFLATDEDPSDNTFFDGTLTVLPPPIISVTPTTGVLGKTVTVHGSGFPSPQPGFGTPPILVSFDDMFMGFSLAKEGSFQFTFSIPHAEPGSHQIKALDGFSGIQVSTEFTVLETPDAQPTSRIDVSVTTGPLYFPGETAVVHVLTSVNGLPQSQGVQVQATLHSPGGTTQELSLVSVGIGVYRAEYSVPRSGSLGTYSIVATATHSESHSSGIATFQVKPTWISANAPRIATATVAIGGILATIGLAWRKGYFRRSAENEQDKGLPTQTPPVFDM